MIETTDWQKAVPTDTPLYAMTDVHGCADLLKQLHAHLERLLENNPRSLVVHMGDYIDRGPKNFATLDMVFDFDHPNADHIILPGNHEWMMLEFLDQMSRFKLIEKGDIWSDNGGSKVFKELNIKGKAYPQQATIYEVIREKLVQKLGDKLEKIRSLPTGHICGSYLFVHAGIPPMFWSNVDQVLDYDWTQKVVVEERHPLWVRQPFLGNQSNYNRMIVHGHTIQNGPDVRHNRINLDIGAYVNGRLAMLEVVGDQMRFHIAF